MDKAELQTIKYLDSFCNKVKQTEMKDRERGQFAEERKDNSSGKMTL